ncbi:PREDICTED: RING finger protein 207-like [Priapulus caudatus]|uniref:RING finger protein 207 n=1 Tax=Priapulus caudatus TaxID=37621 RepID=A0ABM1ELT9_PRICU|nr:PREDICTED: RING finger protein 207-like [Priapulus caudatus]
MTNSVLASDMDAFDDESCINRDPLLCPLCGEIYEEPCILSCCHTFCARCLRGRAVDGRMTCPLCSKESLLTEGAVLPSSDNVMKFLVESSTNDEKAACANCDATATFYCGTCRQPLCESCRELTHAARMFQRHEMALLSRRTKDAHRTCAAHAEPFIMFSTHTRTMLCINCFRDADTEGRSRCIDIASARAHASEKLEASVRIVRELHASAVEDVDAYRRLLEELRRSAAAEKEAIASLCGSVERALADTRDGLLADAERQQSARERLFRERLADLAVMLPTLCAYRNACESFALSANEFEFLSLAYLLMQRLSAISKCSHMLRPAWDGGVRTGFRQEYARCLEPLLRLPAHSEQEPAPSMSTPVATSASDAVSDSVESPPATKTPGGDASRRRATWTPPEGAAGAFAEHCRAFEPQRWQLYENLHRLKDRVQELHRDVTVRRCLASQPRVDAILAACARMREQLDEQGEGLVAARAAFEDEWAERQRAVSGERETYEAQLRDVTDFRQENERMCGILRQLQPYMKSIADVVQRIEPGVKKPAPA